MVSASYFLSALAAISTVKATSTQSQALRQASVDANTVSDDLNGLTQQLHSGLSFPSLNFGPILEDLKKLAGDVTKFPDPSNIGHDISDIESILKDAIGAFTGLGGHFTEFLGEAGPQAFHGSADGVISGIEGVLGGIASKIEGIIGFVPEEIGNLIAQFFATIAKF